MANNQVVIAELFKPGKKGCGLTDLTRAITSEETAQKLFETLGLIPLATRCECGSRFLMQHKDSHCKLGFRWYCTAVSCGRRFSPLKNTWFERSHLSFLKNFELICHWFYRMPLAITMADTKLPEHTAGDWRSFCREVCRVIISQDKKKICGPGLWVEVDEAHLFRRKYNRGHRIKGESIWIFGGLCRETKERFIVRVPDRKKRTLWPILKKHVAPGTILVTDDFKSYVGVESYGRFGAHESVVHKYNFVNPLFPEVFTNGTECMWSKVKKFVKRSGSDESVDQYLAEFLYRFKLDNDFGKHNFGPQFLEFLNDIKKVYPGPNRRRLSMLN